MRARWFLLAPLLLALHRTRYRPRSSGFPLQTAHLISYSSDGNERGARDAAQRSEQLIAVFGEIFHRQDITFSTPLRAASRSCTAERRDGDCTALIRTPAANFVIVDLSQPDSWPQAAKSIAALTLER